MVGNPQLRIHFFFFVYVFFNILDVLLDITGHFGYGVNEIVHFIMGVEGF